MLLYFKSLNHHEQRREGTNHSGYLFHFYFFTLALTNKLKKSREVRTEEGGWNKGKGGGVREGKQKLWTLLVTFHLLIQGRPLSILLHPSLCPRRWTYMMLVRAPLFSGFCLGLASGEAGQVRRLEEVSGGDQSIYSPRSFLKSCLWLGCVSCLYRSSCLSRIPCYQFSVIPLIWQPEAWGWEQLHPCY